MAQKPVNTRLSTIIWQRCARVLSPAPIISWQDRHIDYPAVPSPKSPPNTATMQGLNIAGLKKHPSLIPLFVCLGAGVAMSALYTLRLAVRNPDVTWKHVANPEPQKEWADKQYKFYSPVRDYDTYRAPVPKYED